MRLVLIATAVAAVSLAGCGKTEKQTDPAAAGTATVESLSAAEAAKNAAEAARNATVAAKDAATAAKVATGAAAAGSKLPAFAPVYAGGKMTSAVSGLTKGDADTGTFVYTVDATPAQITDFYKAKGEAAGFKTSLDSDMGQARMYAGSDEATERGMQVIASAADGKTTVQVMWAARK